MGFFDDIEAINNEDKSWSEKVSEVGGVIAGTYQPFVEAEQEAVGDVIHTIGEGTKTVAEAFLPDSSTILFDLAVITFVGVIAFHVSNKYL